VKRKARGGVRWGVGEGVPGEVGKGRGQGEMEKVVEGEMSGRGVGGGDWGRKSGGGQKVGKMWWWVEEEDG